ncbi:MAG: PqqD family protein [Elusimicrobia bacterium]|nr:PqqD family protein [Elusimicrobiota bacterium]
MPKIAENLIIRKFGDEYFLLDSKEEKLHSLNETGSLIFSLLLKNFKKDAIAKKMATEYEIDDQTAFKDVEEFILVLSKKGII